MATFSNTNNTGSPDQIDSADYVMNIIRTIRKYPQKRKSEVEKYKPSENAKGASLQQEKAHQKGYLDALNDMQKFLDIIAKGI
jgi:hypothetical protein